MSQVQVYEVEEINGVQYVTTNYRGVMYTMMPHDGGFGVSSRRIALGRWNFGSFKHFDTLDSVCANCKAFSDFFAMDHV